MHSPQTYVPGAVVDYCGATDPRGSVWRATITRADGTITTHTFDNASRLTGLAQDLPGTANDQTLSERCMRQRRVKG